MFSAGNFQYNLLECVVSLTVSLSWLLCLQNRNYCFSFFFDGVGEVGVFFPFCNCFAYQVAFVWAHTTSAVFLHHGITKHSLRYSKSVNQKYSKVVLLPPLSVMGSWAASPQQQPHNSIFYPSYTMPRTRSEFHGYF